MAELSSLGALLAVGKACDARLQKSFLSRSNKGGPSIALGSHQGGGEGRERGGVIVSASAVPHCGTD